MLKGRADVAPVMKRRPNGCMGIAVAMDRRPVESEEVCVSASAKLPILYVLNMLKSSSTIAPRYNERQVCFLMAKF